MARKIFMSKKRIVTLFLMALLLATPIMPQIPKGVARDYQQGRRDGRRHGRGDASIAWVLPGCCCGCFGIAAAYLWPQSVPAGRLVGKGAGYVRGYNLSYKKTKRERETIYAAVGCIIGNIAGYYGYYYLD